VTSWAKELQEVVRCKSQPVPKGWLTATQMAAEAGLTSQYMMLLAKKGVASGFLLMQKFKIRSGRSVRPVAHYKKNERGKLHKDYSRAKSKTVRR
jgi:hypothetical protein